MSSVILGAGNVGFKLARQLIYEDSDVVLIEKDPKKAESASQQLDCLVLNEPGNSLETLRKAGVENASNFVAVTDSDEINMIACGIVASEFKVPRKIARVRNIDYWNTSVLKQSFLGIDYVVSPEIEVARAITSAVDRGAVSDIMFFEKTGLQMRSVSVSGETVFAGRTIEEIRSTINVSFLVAVIFRYGDYIIPSGDSRIHENDKLYLIASENDFEHLFAVIGKEMTTINKIVIVGGGKIGQYVADHLLHEGKHRASFWSRLVHTGKPATRRRVTILEPNYERCKWLADRYPSALVVNADISDEQFSEDDMFSSMDLVAATSDSQELNIVTAIYAKSLGTKRTIALVNKSTYVHIASSLGIDVAISPVDSMVSTILKYIRKANVRSLHSISGGNLDVIEVSVEATSKVVDKRIRDIRLPPNALIISVARGESNIVPSGGLELIEGDYLIIIANKESIQKLEEIFTG